MPVLTTSDGVEFDKRRIVLYAYRHSYAQRHADAGVPIDVLRELMDHRKLDTPRATTQSATVVAARPSTGSLLCSSTGTGRVSGDKHKPCWTPVTPAARSVRPSCRSGSAPNRPTFKPAVTPAPTGSVAQAATAHERAVRLAARVQHMERRLSESLGEQAWRESGLGAPADIDQLNQRIVTLEQHVVDVRLQLEERTQDLDAARATNPELMTRLNTTRSSR